MSNRMLNWRILLAVFLAATLALAPAIAEARAGSSAGGRSSSMGSRGSRTFENNGAQPLSRSVTPLPQPSRPPGFAPAAPAPAFGGGSFFQRHPFMTGLAGGFIGSWLFGHSGWAAGEGGGSGASMLGTLLQLLIIGLLIYFAVRLFRRRSYANGGRGGGLGWPPRSPSRHRRNAALTNPTASGSVFSISMTPGRPASATAARVAASPTIASERAPAAASTAAVSASGKTAAGSESGQAASSKSWT